MKKKALILGVTGQDGSYLAEILLEKGYEVFGLVRRSATGNTKNIRHLLDKIKLEAGDLADAPSLYRIIQSIKPHEIYNEADQDHAGWSYHVVDYASDITGAAPGRLMEIICQTDKKIKYFQPLTSNMFGQAEGDSQNENTPLKPQSPYACAKAYAWMLVRYFREVHGLFASTGIFFNHESPRRVEEYVTRKITKAAVRISMGLQDKLLLGNIDIRIDFGYAKDYMEAAHSILQLEKADDFIIGTGEIHSVREWAEEAFRQVGLDANKYIQIDPKFFRPGGTASLRADATKAKKTFGFKQTLTFKELIACMIAQDKEDAENEIKIKKC